jgi:hypothetical protein
VLEDQELTFDAAIDRLMSWLGRTVEVWVEFADAPSHVAGTHGELREDGMAGDAWTFSVGESGWFRAARAYDDDSERERLVEYAISPPKLMFNYSDGTLHVAQSSSSTPT